MTGLMLLGPFVCEVGVGTIATVPDRFGNLWLNQQEKEECRLGVVWLQVFEVIQVCRRRSSAIM